MKRNKRNIASVTLEGEWTFSRDDLDENGHVGFHTVERKVYEVQRQLFTNITGTQYEEILRSGGALLHRGFERSRHSQPIMDNQIVVIRTRLERIRHAVMTFESEITDKKTSLVLYNEKRKLEYMINDHRARLPHQFDSYQIA